LIPIFNHFPDLVNGTERVSVLYSIEFSITYSFTPNLSGGIHSARGAQNLPWNCAEATRILLDNGAVRRTYECNECKSV